MTLRHSRIDVAALHDVGPVLLAIAPFAFFIGVQIDSTPGNRAGSLAGSFLLYAGSAQVSALTLMTQGAGLAALLLTVALVNSRFMLYGAGLATRFVAQPRWFRLIAPHFVIDQTYALVTMRDDLGDRARFRRYWMTSGLTIGAVWVAVMTAGVLLGPVVPASAATTSVPVWVFVGLLVPALRSRADVVAALVAGAVATVTVVPSSARVLIAIVAGAGAGLAMRAARR
jgi:predicted branched-subunit amino acid permease